MVNDSTRHGNARVELPTHQLRPNRKAGSLKVGDAVKPNFADAKARRAHCRGVIERIEQGRAYVRWERERAQWSELIHLVAD